MKDNLCGTAIEVTLFGVQDNVRRIAEGLFAKVSGDGVADSPANKQPIPQGIEGMIAYEGETVRILELVLKDVSRLSP